jgi:hypothetical protein
MKVCCANCFQSRFVRNIIRQRGSRGHCDFCGKVRVKVLAARKLQGVFAPLLEHFDPAYEGEHYHKEGILDVLDFDSLGEAIQDSWPIFNGSMDSEDINDLLDAIRGLDNLHPDDDRESLPSNMGWASKEDHLLYEKPEHLWAEFADQIKRQRRFIFTDRFARPEDRPERWIRSALEAMGAIKKLRSSEVLYRARTGCIPASGNDDRQPFPASQMGAPPVYLARAARANPEGIRMFYAALERDTAVCEAGRSPGAVVSVRRVKPLRQLRLADLSVMRGIRDPFNAGNLETSLWRSGLLNQLNHELARPVHPNDSAIEYIPTQYLTEAIRDAGFDGILYRSAMHADGHNAVIFDPDDIRVLEHGAEMVTVQSVHFTLSTSIQQLLEDE